MVCDPQKPVVKCTPKLPKSLARNYSLNTFVNTLEKIAAVSVKDDRFKPVVNEEGWCGLRASLLLPPRACEFIDLSPHTMEVIDCGFEIDIPVGYELQFHPLYGSKLLLTDATNHDFQQRRVRVNVINYSSSSVCIRHGDRIGEMCVRPIGNIPILVEENDE